MKNTLKYFIVMSLAVSLILGAVGCGKGETDAGSGAGTEEQKGYLSEYMDLGEGISDMALSYGMQQLGDELCYISDDQDGGQILDKYFLTDGSRTSISFTWLEPAKRHYITRFSFAENGGIYAIVYQYSETDSGGNSFLVKQLCGFDAQGNQSFAVDISEQLSEESRSGVNSMMATDAQGHIYIAGKTKVWLYDLQEGTEPDYRGEVSVCSGEGEEGQISSILCGKDGNAYVCCRRGESISSNVYSLAQIDFDKCRIGKVYEDFPGEGGIVPGLEKDFLVHDDSDVYEYDLTSGTMEPVLNWVDNNVAGNEVQYFGTLTDGRIYAVTTDWEKDDSGVMIFSRAAGDEQTDGKEEIVFAYLYPNNIFQKAVVDFNKSSDQYRIVLKEYDGYDRLLVDLTANCPDILDLNGLSVKQLASAGVLEDLSPYLDNSQMLDRSDYLENVLEAYTYDGKLVTIPSSFWLQTVFASAEGLKEVFGTDIEGGWTVEELMAYADANPEAELFDGFSKSSIMYYLMMYGHNSFIDWETGKCSFDSDRFKQVLEFVERFPDEVVSNSASTPARIEAGEVLLAAEYINRFDGLQLFEEMFGGEAACVGFPTADGSTGCRFYANNALAISSGSSHKEGAWAFMESFLANEDYEDTNDFVTNRAWLEKKAATALAAEYATRDDGTLVEVDGKYVMINYSAYTVTYEDGWTFSSHIPTEEEIQQIFALIQMAHQPGGESDMILNIIDEEAEAFYQGQKSVDAVAKIIQNRAQVYINENIN